ncbi:hypothetical protein BDN67DRAFT_984752 [Paxillus ammoniavirescens]|nr:hypothetical protein BDN67DRAFT_984752 [Paxillus ammoniavirescens]
MTTAQPTLIHQPGGRMTTAKKATRPKQMMKAQQATGHRRLKEHRDDIESEDEDPIGNATAGSTSSAGRMTTTPSPAPPSTPPHTPIPVPTPAQQRQGHQCCWRGAQELLAVPQPVNTCLTCVNFGILCEPNPGYSCFTCQSRKKKCKQSGMTRGQSTSCARQPIQSRSAEAHSQRGTPAKSRAPSKAPAPRSQRPSHATSSKQGTSVNTQPPANPQDCPNVASSSTGIMLRILPSQATHKSFQLHKAAKDINHLTAATTIRMESAPQTSAVKAPVNMGLILGTVYSSGRNPLVSHEEHHTALQQPETVEGENCELCGIITQALDHIEVLEQGMASLGRVCEATRQSITTSPTDFNRTNMGFPFEQEGSTAASDQDLHPAEPSHSPSPSLPSNTIAIPSAVNLDMCWHIGPAIIRSTTPIPPFTSFWTSSDIHRSQSMPATATIYSGPQTSSADNPLIPAPLMDDPPIPAPLTDDPPILPPVSPTMSIPPVEVLAETESASDNGGSGDNNGSGENDGSRGSN